MSQKPPNSSAQDSYRHAIDEALAINPQEEDIMSYPNLQEFNPQSFQESKPTIKEDLKGNNGTKNN